MPLEGDVTLIDVPAWLDLLTIVVAALGGALFASRRGVTVTGVLLIAVAAGLGGGMIRDVLLDVGPPLAISDRAYLPAAAIAAVCGMLLARWSNRLAWPMLLLDSLALGLFAVVGVERTLAADYPPASAVLIGVIAAIAGGIIRDLLAGDAPAIMQAGPWDASAALVGAVVMVVLVVGLDVPTGAVEWPIILLIAALVVLSTTLGWRAPMAQSLEPVLVRPVAVVRRVTRPGTRGPSGRNLPRPATTAPEPQATGTGVGTSDRACDPPGGGTSVEAWPPTSTSTTAWCEPRHLPGPRCWTSCVRSATSPRPSPGAAPATAVPAWCSSAPARRANRTPSTRCTTAA